jgi:zinc/manganese transport system substrate-binding protein
VLFGAACGVGSQSGAEGKVDVVVSVNQWKSLASEIGGDKAEVTSILANQNVEAHDFEPQPSDIAKLTTAKVVVVNGADYDSWATKAMQNASGVAVVNAAKAGGISAGQNPHTWFSASVRKATAKAYLAQLKKAAPDDSHYFDEQYAAWQKKEAGLDEATAAAKKETGGVAYGATESVVYYLAKDLGMKDATPTGYAQAVENESEPAPGDIKTFQGKLENGDIKLLIVNDQEKNSTTTMIEKTAKTSKVPIVHLSESMPSKYTSLVTWVEALVDDFEKTSAH